MTDKDDVTIEEARRADVYGNHLETARRIIALCDIATRRGERIKELEGKLTRPKCDHDEESVVAEICDNAIPGWEQERMRVAAIIRRRIPRTIALEEIDSLRERAEHSEAERDALAEESKRLREALERITRGCAGAAFDIARAALSRGGE